VAGVAVVAASRPAEDAVQEALARAWERSERGEHIRNLEAWVTTVALNLARSGLRRVRSERAARERLRGRQPIEPSETRVDVVRALSALPRRQREATVLRYYLGYDVKEIADVLRIREGTAKTTLHRARLALAERLGEDLSEEASERGR
jgi:RNA polymerase sigma-70 factor, ECF subfamily